jgi:hypothetical protein
MSVPFLLAGGDPTWQEQPNAPAAFATPLGYRTHTKGPGKGVEVVPVWRLNGRPANLCEHGLSVRERSYVKHGCPCPRVKR